MRTAKTILALVILSFLTMGVTFKILNPDTFESCIESKGGYTDTNCEACQHLIKN